MYGMIAPIVMPRLSKKEFSLYLFGTFRLEKRDGNSTSLVRLQRRKVELLFAYLVLHPEPNGHAREKIAALFWGDTTDEQARTSLRTHLAVLRKALGEGALTTTRGRIELNPDLKLHVDVWEFLRLRVGSPETAIDFYHAALLADVDDEWVETERARLRSLYVESLLRVTQQLRSQSEYDRAMDLARKAIQVDPANETAYQHLMFCEMVRGNRVNALKRYDECEQALRDQCAVVPSAETQALYHWIKQTPATFAPNAARTTNLPIPLSSFVGREKELAQIKSILMGTRLLTLVGAGGSGKTRLSIQVSMELMNTFRDGVWWVELANLSNAALVPQAVAKALNIAEVAHLTMTETLVQILGSKQMLLILDNCEHLLAASAQLVNELIRHCPDLKILTTSREPLNVAREAVWQVSTMTVPNELLTRTQLLMGYEGVRLFVERARAVNPNFALTDDNALDVIEICQRLDGIPLAIELAAARTQVLSARQIAARLDNRFSLLTSGNRTALARQQTLRALIDWSYDLLSEIERIILRRLAVFQGGWTLQAAEAVVGDQGQINVPQVLSQLVNKSLIYAEQDHVGDTRYNFLDTIRHYAHEKLDESGEEEILQARHRDWFISFAELADAQTRTAEQLLWLSRLELEHNNLRAALEYSRQQAQKDNNVSTIRLAAALGRFWGLRGYWSEGRAWLAPALECNLCTAAHAKALLGLAELVSWQESYTISQPIYEASLSIGRMLGDKWSIACASTHSLIVEDDDAKCQAMFDEGLSIAQEMKDFWLTAMAFQRMSISTLRRGQDATTLLEQGLAYARQTGDRWLISSALNNLGEILRSQQDYVRVAPLYEEALAIQRVLDDKSGIISSLHNLGHVALRQGDPAHASALFKESLALNREHGRKRGMAECWAGLAGVAAARRLPVYAAKLLGAADALFVEIKTTMDPADRFEFDHNATMTRQQITEDEFYRAWEEGRVMTLDQTSELAMTI